MVMQMNADQTEEGTQIMQMNADQTDEQMNSDDHMLTDVDKVKVDADHADERIPNRGGCA